MKFDKIIKHFWHSIVKVDSAKKERKIIEQLFYFPSNIKTKGQSLRENFYKHNNNSFLVLCNWWRKFFANFFFSSEKKNKFS